MLSISPNFSPCLQDAPDFREQDKRDIPQFFLGVLR